MAITLKKNTIYDIYEGEAPVAISKMTSPKPVAVIARASWQGLGTRNRGEDTEVINYSKQCKDANIPFGVYHFLTPNGIAEQANLFISVWNKLPWCNLPPIVDVEVDLVRWYPHPTGRGQSSIGNAVWQGHVKTFLDLVAAGTGKTPIIYTNQNYWQYVCTKSGLTWSAPVWTKDYPLWVAQYPYQPDMATKPASLPLGWTDWAIWQYNDQGRTNGFLANDLNTASDAFVAEIGQVPDTGGGEDPGDIITSIPETITVSFNLDDGTTQTAQFKRL